MLDEINTFYIIGIGGISMSAIAKLLQKEGKLVYGSDVTSSKITEKLLVDGIELKIGNAPEFVCMADAIIITGAIGEDNPDLILARKLGKPIFSRAEILGELTKDKKLVSIAGTHGKTTTTGMISSILLKSGLDPTIHIGGILNNIHSNLYIGKGDLFVTEACEYKDSFLSLNNYISIILNVQEDHLDYFKNLDNIFRSFNKFAENTKEGGIIIYNYDEKDDRLSLSDNVLSFGAKKGADVEGRKIEEYSDGKYSFKLFYKGKFVIDIKLPCYGKHNIYNALASSACALFLGIEPEIIKKGIEEYDGVERRNEEIREQNGHLILHDYAHHPTEINASISSFREIKKNGKIIAVFQPHTFSRTRDLFNQFVNCFSYCDEVWLLPIYPAREKPIKGITSKRLAKEINNNGKKCRYFSSFSNCYKEINKNFYNVDLFAILGAGDIEKLAYQLKENK